MGNVGIYKIESPSGKVYIGQSIDIQKRYQHYRTSKKRIKQQPKLYASLSKYGWSLHKFSVIHELPNDVSSKVLDDYEILYIQLYKDCGVQLLNVKGGGAHGRHSEETKRKISASSDKVRLYRRGIPVSQEAKVKMRGSAIRRGNCHKPFTDEQLDDLRKRAASARQKITHRGSRKGRKGSRSKKIICSKTNRVFGSAKEAAKEIGWSANTLRAMLNGQNPNKTTLNYL